jgi:SAM-dependent MidA family methyltransferase
VNGRSAGDHVRRLGPLGEELQHLILTTGPMPFASFMRLALYHPIHGYYASRVPGHGADYRTSPSIGPWFGRLVGRALRRVWEDLERPDPFWVIEVGAGLGDLAAGAMKEAGPMAGALRWRFVEQFERVAAWQRRRLGSAAWRAEWTPGLGDNSAPVCGCVLANEVLDAFPVHVLEIVAERDVREVYVGLDSNRFVETLGSLSVADLAAPSKRAAACLSGQSLRGLSSVGGMVRPGVPSTGRRLPACRRLRRLRTGPVVAPALGHGGGTGPRVGRPVARDH